MIYTHSPLASYTQTSYIEEGGEETEQEGEREKRNRLVGDLLYIGEKEKEKERLKIKDYFLSDSLYL